MEESGAQSSSGTDLAVANPVSISSLIDVHPVARTVRASGIPEFLTSKIASCGISSFDELAETFARESRESIAWLPESPAQRALMELPDFVLSRLY